MPTKRTEEGDNGQLDSAGSDRETFRQIRRRIDAEVPPVEVPTSMRDVRLTPITPPRRRHSSSR